MTIARDLSKILDANGDLTIDTNTLFVDSSTNRVGIGTSSPSRLLELSSSGPIFRITDTTNNTYGEILVNDLGSITLRADEGNSQGNSIIQFDVDGSEAMRIDSSGNVLIGATSTASSNYGAKFLKDDSTSEILAIHRQASDGDFIQFTRGGSDSGNIKHSGGNLVINAVNDFEIQTNDGTDVVHVGSNGNVGIGTTSPDEILHISGADATFVIQESSNAGNGNAIGKIVFKSSNGNNNSMINMEQIGGSSGGELVFSTRPFTGTLAERMRIKSNGDIFFKNTTESAINGGSTDGKFIDNADGCRLRSSRASTSTREHIIFYNPNGDVGDISTSGTSTSYNTSSDYRLKENVVEITGATERLKQLHPKRFNFIADADTTVDGFLAHEVSSIVPEAISGTHNEVEVWKEGEELPEGVSVGDNKLDDEGNTIPVYQGIDQSKLVPLLTASLKEAINKIEQLEARISALET